MTASRVTGRLSRGRNETLTGVRRGGAAASFDTPQHDAAEEVRREFEAVWKNVDTTLTLKDL
jgi:hypothetical protein